VKVLDKGKYFVFNMNDDISACPPTAGKPAGRLMISEDWYSRMMK
jgi:hypothetical protein